jgi:hypothetical protein
MVVSSREEGGVYSQLTPWRYTGAAFYGSGCIFRMRNHFLNARRKEAQIQNLRHPRWHHARELALVP